MPRASLSTAESTVLGIVWREGPCTTYTVMLVLSRSPSSFFRKRASSTYTVVQKLMSRGLLQPLGDEVGTRGDRKVELTAAGRQVLKVWLSAPIPPVEVAYSNDLIRLRTNFIAALEPAEQIAAVEDALRILTDLEKEYDNVVRERKDASQMIAPIGLLYETRARIAWLEYIKTLLPISRTPIDLEPGG